MARPMTLDQILEALRTAPPLEDSTGYRVEEIRDATGMAEDRIRREIRRGMEAGTVRRVLRMIEGIDGRRTTVPAYEFLDVRPVKRGGKG